MQSKIITKVKENFAVDDNELSQLMSILVSRPVDDADIFLQSLDDEYWVLEDGIIKNLNISSDKGIGFRSVRNETTGYAYSEDFTSKSLRDAAFSAQIVGKDITGLKLKKTEKGSSKFYNNIHPFDNYYDKEKSSLLHDLENEARRISKNVEKVTASISSRYEEVLIMRLDGSMFADVRPLVRIGLMVVCSNGKQRYSGNSSLGGRYDIKSLDRKDIVAKLAREAVKLAMIQFEAKAAPAGEMPVVLGSGWPGVLLHEAVGHGLEGDFNRKKTSAFSGKIGEKVASSSCTVVDDATIYGRRGSLSIDDEGTRGQRTVLIENGILKGYMHDRLSARLFGTSSTGNGRRESYEYIPLPRMTNTFLEPGEYNPEEIIKTVKQGIYAVNFSGGQVDITSGKFVFSANDAYMIRDGKIAEPIKGATIVGDGPSVMKKVSMVGNDFNLDSGIGICGKDGQSIPVGVGQPTVKIDEITVGGTETN
jgi:TldD protein